MQGFVNLEMRAKDKERPFLMNFHGLFLVPYSLFVLMALMDSVTH